MLSSDKNVETIAQLIEVLKHYLGLQAEYVKLDLVDKVVRLLTAATLAIVLLLVFIGVMLFFAFGLANWLSQYVGTTAAFFLVSALHLLLLILIFIFRKPMIEKPLVRFLAGLLLGKR